MPTLTTKTQAELREHFANAEPVAPDRLAYLVHDAKHNYEYKLKKLAKQSTWIREKMERLERECAAAAEGKPCSINNLGELQAQGSELDRLCGEMHDAAQHLAALQFTFGVE